MGTCQCGVCIFGTVQRVILGEYMHIAHKLECITQTEVRKPASFLSDHETMQQEHLTRDNGWQSDGSDLITYCAFPAAMDLVYLYTNDQCLRFTYRNNEAINEEVQDQFIMICGESPCFISMDAY
jgi:hypothetical protein